MGCIRPLGVLLLAGCLVETLYPQAARDMSPSNLNVVTAQLPLLFEENRGQAASGVRFLTRAGGYLLTLSADSSQIRLGASAANLVEMRLLGGIRQPRVLPEEDTSTRTNYYVGDPKSWLTDIPNYRRVRYREAYRGIDLVYHGNHGQVQFDFVLAPGADSSNINVLFSGADKMELDRGGDLVLRVGTETLTYEAPVIYQEIDGRRTAISGSFVLHKGGKVGVRVGHYDHSRELVIDPSIVYSTYFVGSAGTALAVDSSGSAYIAGSAIAGMPVVNAAEPAPAAFFVAKLNPAGNALVYSTYLGSSGATSFYDYVSGIAVDPLGNAYMTGSTTATNYPTTAGAFQRTLKGLSDAFITKLNASGSVAYSTLLGGSDSEGASETFYGRAGGIAVDGSGSAYVTGTTFSSDFPTQNPIQSVNATPGFPPSAFITKLTPDGSGLVYSTYFGGTGWNEGAGIAVDSSGEAYVTGITGSPDFPTRNAYIGSKPSTSSVDAFLLKLDSGGNLVFSTYFGAPFSYSIGQAIAVDASGSAFIGGSMEQVGTVTWPLMNASQTTCVDGPGDSICRQAFLAKFDLNGGLIFSTFLGGTDPNGAISSEHWPSVINAIAVDANGNAFVGGRTISNDFPSVSPFQNLPVGNVQGFVSKFSASGSLLYSGRIGGFDGGFASSMVNGVATDPAGNVIVTGTTTSNSFPLHSAFRSLPSGVFVAKITDIAPAPFVGLSPASINFGDTVQGTTVNRNVILSNVGSATLSISSITAGGDYSQGGSCGSTLAAGTSCNITVSFSPSVLGQRPGTLTISDNAAGNPHHVSLTGNGVVAPQATLLPASLVFAAQNLNSTSTAQNLILTNTSGTALAINGIIASGDFAETSNCGSSVPAHGACSISVTFTPMLGGTRTGQVTVNSNAAGSPNVTTLSGSGNGPQVSVSPASLTFPTVLAGSSSGPQRLTLTNTGNQILVITQLSITGNNPGDYSKTTNCVATIQPGGSCIIDVTFTAGGNGARTASVSITTNFVVPQISLTGQGSAPDIMVSPGSLNFSSTAQGVASSPQVLTVTSSGGVPLSLTSIGMQFNLDFQQTNNCPPVLVPMATCQISVVFLPNGANTVGRNNSVIINSNSAANPSDFISVGGAATLTTFPISPLVLNFPPTPPNSQSAGQVTTVYNNSSSQSIVVTNAIPNTGANPGDFVFMGGCGGITLHAGGTSCGNLFVFQPLALGPRSATVTFKNGSTVLGTVTMNGTGAHVAVVGFNPTPLFFSSVQDLGSTSAPSPVTLSNTGDTTLNINNITTSGDFGVANTTCGNLPTTLAANVNCTINVTFTPSTLSGSIYGTLIVADDGPGNPHLLTLHGSAGNPLPTITTISPSSTGAARAGFNLLVNGSNFMPSSKVQWNGNTRITNFISPTQLRAFIPATDVLAAGSAPVTVVNPPTGGGTSNAVTFTINANTPPVGAFETAVNANDNSNTLPQLATLQATGWAADAEDTTVSRVQVRILPMGVTDISGLYIADSGNQLVRRVDSFGTINTIAGNGAAAATGDNGIATNASLNLPKQIAVDSAGNLYIADTVNLKVRKVDVVSKTITTLVSTPHQPLGVAVDGSGHVFVTQNQVVDQITNGSLTAIAGNPNTNNGSFSGDGGLALSATLSNPGAIATDNNGNVLICDVSSRIRKWDHSLLTINTIVGNGSINDVDGVVATSSGVNVPISITVDAAGNIYIGEASGHRIRKVSAGTNIITTIAGTGVAGSSGDGGLATQAMLEYPAGIAVDQDGNVYFADAMHNVIRRIDAITNIVTTVAGNTIGAYSGDGGPAANALVGGPNGLAAIGKTFVSNDAFRDAQLGLSRPDIAASQSQPSWIGSGWTASITVPILQLGAYFVDATAFDSVGASTRLATSKPITVVPGTFPVSTLSASSLSFGNIVLGRTSRTQTLMITNSGNAVLQVSNVSMPNGYTVTNGCTSVSPGNSCPVNVVFQGSGPGQQPGTLTINTNAPGSPQSVALSGNAIDLLVGGVRPTRSSRTANMQLIAGSTIQMPVSVAGAAGLSVTMECIGATGGSSCEIQPIEQAVDGSTVKANLLFHAYRDESGRLAHRRLATAGAYTLGIVIRIDDFEETLPFAVQVEPATAARPRATRLRRAAH